MAKAKTKKKVVKRKVAAKKTVKKVVKKKAAKKVVKKKVVRTTTAKIPKMISISAIDMGRGVSMVFGLGSDNRVYGWSGAVPSGWVLQEFIPPTAPSPEEIADMLQKKQDAEQREDASLVQGDDSFKLGEGESESESTPDPLA